MTPNQIEAVARALQIRDFEGDAITAAEAWGYDGFCASDEYRESYRVDAVRIIAVVEANP